MNSHGVKQMMVQPGDQRGTTPPDQSENNRWSQGASAIATAPGQ